MRADQLSYRPDIDGLRAVAVLSVVAYHLGVKGITGGFSGVDVFFVISGYLITGIITRELNAGKFSLRHFYERRARRILPALTVVLVATSAAAALVLLGPELISYRQSLLSAIFFSSNIHFWQAAGYFAEPTRQQPLLHTWSLAVEEQYYLLFPLLLMLVVRLRRTLMGPVLWAITLISFVGSVLLVRLDSAAAFYLLPSRAWELGAGALLAVGGAAWAHHRWAAHVVSLVGLALIGTGVLLLNETMPFPGERALLPVLGAVAVIASGPASIGGRALSLRPMRAIGLLSYSLYLWHWPFIVLYRLSNPGPLHLRSQLTLFLLSVGAAAVTWWIVERRFRRVRLPRRRHLVGFVAASVVVTMTAAFSVQPAAAMRPSNGRITSILAALTPPKANRNGTCFILSGYDASSFDPNVCLRGPSTKPDFLLLGDSQAAALWAGLRDVLPEVDLLQATASGCRPLIPLSGQARCTTVIREALDGPLRGNSVSTVILAARWQLGDLPRIDATLRLLSEHHRRVIVLGPTSEYYSPLPDLLARGIATGDEGLAARNLDHQRFTVDAALRERVTALGATYISQLDILCDAGQHCREYTSTGVPFKFDYGHYTTAGALEVSQAMRNRILHG